MAAKVLNGKKTTNYPVKHVLKGSYVINTKEAKTLGIQLPANMVKNATAHHEVFK